MSGKESNLEQSYVLLDLAGQVALRVGLVSSRPSNHGRDFFLASDWLSYVSY
jgi:hypothetical protein